MADKRPLTLEELRALPPTYDPVEKDKRNKWKKQIDADMAATFFFFFSFSFSFSF